MQVVSVEPTKSFPLLILISIVPYLFDPYPYPYPYPYPPSGSGGLGNERPRLGRLDLTVRSHLSAGRRVFFASLSLSHEHQLTTDIGVIEVIDVLSPRLIGRLVGRRHPWPSIFSTHFT